jgi:hypothetical protein
MDRWAPGWWFRGNVASTQRGKLNFHDNHQINRLSTLEYSFASNEDIVILICKRSQAMMGPDHRMPV